MSIAEASKARSSLRSGRGQARAAIERAATRLFAAHPADAVAIDDIVREAGVAKGSFYTHFETKDALLAALVADIRGEIEQAIEAAAAGVEDAAARVATAVCLYARYALDRPDRAQVVSRNAHDGGLAYGPLNRGVWDDMGLGILGGRFLIPTAEAGVLLTSAATRALMVRLAGEASRELALGIAQPLVAMLLRGLGVEWTEAQRLAAQSADRMIRAEAPDWRS